MDRDLDKIDQRILAELEANGRLPIVELAARVNLTNTPCSERVKRLEKSGYITGYSYPPIQPLMPSSTSSTTMQITPTRQPESVWQPHFPPEIAVAINTITPIMTMVRVSSVIVMALASPPRKAAPMV